MTKIKSRNTGFRRIFVTITALSLFSFNFANVNAAYNNTDFNGIVGYAYGYVSNSGVTKLNSFLNFTVNWKTSNPDQNTLYFKMVNSNGANRGSKKVTSKGKHTISATSDAWQGYSYWLMASRQHIIDPQTRVTGIWTP